MPSDQIFQFNHSLLRDAALALLSKREKERLHKLALEALQADPLSARESLDHQLRAALQIKANIDANLLFGLAQREAAGSNISDALHLYEMLTALPTAPVAIRLESTLQCVRLHERLGQYTAASSMARRAIKAADAAGEHAFCGRARLRLGALLRRRARFKPALAQLKKAEQHCRASADSAGQAECVSERGLVYQACGEHARAEECFVESERLCRRGGNLEGVCRALGNLAAAHVARGQYQAALAALQEAADLAEILDSPLIRARIAGNRAVVYAEMGDLEKAVKANIEAMTAFQTCGDARGIATTHSNLGGLLSQLGDLDAADSHYLSAEQYSLEQGDPRLAARVLGNRGALCAARGDMNAARKLYSRALAQSQLMQDREHEARLLANIGHSWISEGKPAQALEPYRAALELARSSKLLPEAASMMAQLAQAMLEAGQTSAAQQTALDALDWCDQYQVENAQARVLSLAVLARYEQGEGHLKEAQMLAKEAQDLAQRLPDHGNSGESAEALKLLRGLGHAAALHGIGGTGS